jgi:hypothetical protein
VVCGIVWWFVNKQKFHYSVRPAEGSDGVGCMLVTAKPACFGVGWEGQRKAKGNGQTREERAAGHDESDGGELSTQRTQNSAQEIWIKTSYIIIDPEGSDRVNLRWNALFAKGKLD